MGSCIVRPAAARSEGCKNHSCCLSLKDKALLGSAADPLGDGPLPPFATERAIDPVLRSTTPGGAAAAAAVDGVSRPSPRRNGFSCVPFWFESVVAPSDCVGRGSACADLSTTALPAQRPERTRYATAVAETRTSTPATTPPATAGLNGPVPEPGEADAPPFDGALPAMPGPVAFTE